MALRDIYKISVGLFQAAPGTEYANLLVSMGANGSAADVTALYNTLAASPIFQAQDFDYTSASSNTQFARQFIADLAGGTYLALNQTIVGGTLSQNNFDFAVNYMVAQLNAGTPRGTLMQTVLNAVDNVPEIDPNFGSTASLLHNRISAAQDYTESLNGPSLSIGELQDRLQYVTNEDQTVIAQDNANRHFVMPGETFIPTTTTAAGADVLRLDGDMSVRLDVTNPNNQIRALDLNADGVFSQNGIENFNLPFTQSGNEIFDAYRRDYVVEANIGQNFLGDIHYNGTGFGGDGVNTDGNIVLGGLGVDEIFGGIGNDFIAGGGVASGRFVPQVGPEGGTRWLDTLTGNFVAAPGGDYVDGGRNADFFFVAEDSIDATDGSSLFFIDGGRTADDTSAGLVTSSQDSDWLLLEVPDDDEPISIVLNDWQVDGTGFGFIETNSGFRSVTFDDIENVDASGNLYGFINGMNTVLGERGALGTADPQGNDGIGSSGQLWIEGSGGANKLIGGYDNDAIFGREGDDILMGGNMNKLINPNLLTIVNDGMDHLAGGQGNDDIVFEADGGSILAGSGTDTLWITANSLGTRTAAQMTTDGVIRIDLLAQNIDAAAGYGGADANPTRTLPASSGGSNTFTGTADQTNYNAANSSMRVLINEDPENVIATGLGRIDFAAAGSNNPELVFDNIQNFQRYTGALDLRGTDGNNVLYASSGNDDIEGRDGNDSMSGGDGLDDFFFGTQDGGSIGGQSGYGDGVDVIHRQADATNDNLWDGFNPMTNSGGTFVQDFGVNSSVLQGASNLLVDLGTTNLASPDVAMAVFTIVIGGVTFSYSNIAALTAANSASEVATLVNATFNAQDSQVTVTSSDNTITVTDTAGRNISDTVSEGYAVGGVVSNGFFEAAATFSPAGTQAVLDRLIYVAYEDRADGEEVDDDAVTGSTVSLGVDSYAQDRVVGISSAGTRIAEDQAYRVTFTNITTEDIATITLNNVTYRLQVGVDVDGSQVDAEDGVLDSQLSIQDAFVNRFAGFINSFMDDDTQAGQITAAASDSTPADGFDDRLTITQVAYNGEETVFMFTPTVAIQQLSGGEVASAAVSNQSQHDLNLFGFIASSMGGQFGPASPTPRNGALNADDPSTSAVNDGNVLFWGTEQVNRSVLATARDTHTGLDTGVLNGSQAVVINGDVDDLANVVHNLATDSELQTDTDDDGDIDDEDNGNFAVHGDDLLIGGTGNDTINGLTGDDRVLGSLGNDVVDGGGDWYSVRRVGETQGTVTYFANAYDASQVDLDPDVLEMYVIEQTQDGDNMIQGDNFSDYFEDTLQFQQADFLGTRFTVTLNDFFGTGDSIEFRHGGAGTVGTDVGDNGTIDALTTFRNFEHIRTVSGTGLAVAGAGQGNDTLDVTALSTAAEVGVRYDLTGDDATQGNVDLIEDPDDDPDTDNNTFRTVITVDGVEHVNSGNGDDILLIDETEAAKNNTFSAGLGDDEIMYLNDFDDPDVEPTVTINVEVSTNVDTVVMTDGRVGTTVATDTLNSVETITLEENTAQGIREDDTINVTNITDATVNYVTGEIFEGDDLVLTINNIFEMEFVIADGNDTVIVADHSVMSLNSTSDSWAERKDWVIESYLNYDFVNEDDVSDRLSLGELRAGEVDILGQDIPENRNFHQFNFELGPNSDTVDYSNETARIVAIANFNPDDDTQYVGVDGNNSGQYRGAQDRVDRIVDTENIVASQGESIIDVTQSNMDLAISFSREITVDGGRDIHRVQMANLNTDVVFGMNYLEYRDNNVADASADIFAVWETIEGSDFNEKVELTDAETEFDHSFYLRGGDNEVNYNELTRSIEVTIDVNDFDPDDPANTGNIIADVLFTDGNGVIIGGTDHIESYSAQNEIAAGSLRIEASQDAEDSISFAAGLTKLFILGETVDGSDQITVIVGDAGNENSIVLTGFEFLRDAPSDDVYTMEDLTRVVNNLTLVDNPIDDTDTILVFDDAIGFQAAPADTISLEVLNTEFRFDFDILDVTQVTEGDLLLVGDDGPGLALPDVTFLGPVDVPANNTTTSVLGATPILTNLELVFDDDWYQVNLVAGTTYRFDLEGAATGMGTAGDPFLTLYDTTVNGNGFLDSNDDSGVGTNSLLLYTPAVSGTYFLSTTEFFGLTGTETLTASIPRDLNDAVRVGDLDLIDDVSLFPVIIFTDASIASAGDTFNIDVGAGEFQDGGGNVLFTFDPTLFTFDFTEVSPATNLTITVDDPGALGVTIITDGNDTITGGAGNDTITGGAGPDVLDGGTATETRTVELSGILDVTVDAPAVTIALGAMAVTFTINESAAPADVDPSDGTLDILAGSGSDAVGALLAQLVSANLALINVADNFNEDDGVAAADTPANPDVALMGAVYNNSTNLLTFTFASGTDVDVDDAIVVTSMDTGVSFAASTDTTIEEGGGGGGDLFRYTAVSDGADTISGFVPGLFGDNIGFAATDDPDAPALGDLIDDSDGGTIAPQNASDNNAAASQPCVADPEGLFIFDAGNNNGNFPAANLTNLSAVAALFETNFALNPGVTANSDALLVLESDTVGTFGFYFWDSANTNQTFEASELTLLGVATGTAVSNADFLIVN